MGNHAEAIESFDRGIAADGDASAYEGFFLAMCHDRLGRLDEGQEWLATSIRWMEENAPDDPELVRFRREAEALHAELTR